MNSRDVTSFAPRNAQLRDKQCSLTDTDGPMLHVKVVEAHHYHAAAWLLLFFGF